MNDKEAAVIDSNILVYAFDVSEGLKHTLANELLQEILEGKTHGILTSQILSEFFVNITDEKKKAGVNIPLSVEEAEIIINDIIRIDNISVFDVKSSDVLEAIKIRRVSKASYWDCLIAATMKANKVTTIYTEDKAFEKIEGIKVVNPFVNRST